MVENEHHPSLRDRPKRQVANLVPFPSCWNVRLVEDLIYGFLAIPPGPDRPKIFRKKELGQLERKRRALGIPPDLVKAEIRDVEQAVAARLAEIFSKDRSKA